MAKVLLVSQNCPHCPQAAMEFNHKYPQGKIVYAESEEGGVLIRKYNITEVPTELEV